MVYFKIATIEMLRLIITHKVSSEPLICRICALCEVAVYQTLYLDSRLAHDWQYLHPNSAKMCTSNRSEAAVNLCLNSLSTKCSSHVVPSCELANVHSVKSQYIKQYAGGMKHSAPKHSHYTAGHVPGKSAVNCTCDCRPAWDVTAKVLGQSLPGAVMVHSVPDCHSCFQPSPCNQSSNNLQWV